MNNTESKYFVNIVTFVDDCYNELEEYVFEFIKGLPDIQQKEVFKSLNLKDFEGFIQKVDSLKKQLTEKIEKIMNDKPSYFAQCHQQYLMIRAMNQSNLSKTAIEESLAYNRNNYIFEPYTSEEGFYLSKQNYKTSFENLNNKMKVLISYFDNYADISHIKKYPCAELIDAHIHLKKMATILSDIEQAFDSAYDWLGNLEK